MKLLQATIAEKILKQCQENKQNWAQWENFEYLLSVSLTEKFHFINSLGNERLLN